MANRQPVMIGYDSAFIGGTIALPSFKEEFNWSQYDRSQSDNVSANIVSTYQAGAFFGAFGAYVVGHYWGRKIGLQVFGAIFILGCGLMLGANGARGLGLIYAGRALAGFGVGGASNLTPIYISELSPPAIRGRLVGLYELGWQVGGLVGFWINYGVLNTMPASHEQWLVPFAVQLVPAGIMFFGLFFIRESPRWLLGRGQRERALRNLCWIRNLDSKDIYIIEEVSAMDTALDHQAATVGIGFWQPFKALGRDRNGLIFLAECLRHQRHKLLLSGCFQEHRCRGDEHRPVHYWHLWRHQDSFHPPVAIFPCR